MHDTPRISVLMAVFNGEHYLREAMDSILTQTFRDFEFLILNDGSSDASRSIILEYKDARIRLIDNEQNIGLTKSLNRGLALARGEFIARQDADDVSLPERLARQVAFMDANPHIVLLGSWYEEVDAKGAFRDRVQLPTDEVELRWSLLFYCPFVHSAVMLRRSPLLHEAEYYSNRYEHAEDHELWLRIARRKSLTNLRAYLVKYRRHPGSVTARYGESSKGAVQLCVDSIGDLLAWRADDPVRNEALYREMFDVLYGEHVALNLEEITQTTSLIWRLHRAFCEAYELSPRQVRIHQKKLRTWIGRRYILIANELLDRGRPDEAWSLFYRGYRQSIRSLFRLRTFRYLSKMVRREKTKVPDTTGLIRGEDE